MESDTCYGDFIVKSIWKLSDYLIYRVFFMKTPDNIQTNFTIKSSHYLHTVSILTIMETVWRVILLCRFMVKLIWRLSGK